MNNISSALSLPQFPARTTQSDSTDQTRPTTEENAAQLKQFLLSLSKQEENKEFRGILRAAADKIREKAFGVNRSVVKRKIISLIREFEHCEMDDFLDEIKASRKDITFALEELTAEGRIEIGQRRRYQEVGKHYNTTYQIIK